MYVFIEKFLKILTNEQQEKGDGVDMRVVRQRGAERGENGFLREWIVLRVRLDRALDHC